MHDQTSNLLQQHFGFSTFREGQKHVVDAVLNGQSAAAIFPTGSGKSLCYQLPALVLPHLTLVISPLLALMQDQLAFLANKGISAASIDSMQTREQGQDIMQRVRTGEIKILMISVERLNNERFRQFLKQIKISLLVVDEAHCISEWGHNFRPDYLKLPTYQKQFNIPQTLLLTATATKQVCQDMSDKFAIAPENIISTGFYRKNLNLSVQGLEQRQKQPFLASWLAKRRAESGIIYVTLQQTAEQVASFLSSSGIQAQAYHAGMESDKRQQIQKQFMQGELKLIVATIAFGMGIDKSDIRYVVHYDLPKSIENYAQEIGRAGRDDAPSDCLVLANSDNINVLENFVYGDTPEPHAISFVIDTILEQGRDNNGQFEIVLNSLSSQSNIRMLSLKTLLVYLELEQLISPAFSYFAEYKFKLKCSEKELIDAFSGERQTFVNALLDSSDKAKIWYSINFDSLNQYYPSERSRVVSALDYFDEKNFIELQTKQMTEVYRVNTQATGVDGLSQKVYQKFIDKEHAEVARIHNLLSFFTSDQCLSAQMATYFDDHQLSQPCGHCSVCSGNIAVLPQKAPLKPLSEYDFQHVCQAIMTKLGTQSSVVLISRFLCGLTTPIFTKMRVRQLQSFALFEQYRFSEIKQWVEQHYNR